MDIVDFYKGILPLAGMSDKGGKVYSDISEKVLTVNGKDVVMPISENLRAKSVKVNQVFHPCAEDVTMAPSLTVLAYRRSAAFFYNHVLFNILVKLSELGSSVKLQDALTVKEKAALGALPDINTNDLKLINKLLLVRSTKSFTTNIVQINLASNHVVDGTKYKRTCIVRSGLLKDIENVGKSLTIDGIKFTKRALKALSGLIKMVMPNIENDGYDIGQQINGCPLVESMTRSLNALLIDINKISIIVDNEVVKEPLDLDAYFGDRRKLTTMISSVPPIRGNRGGESKTKKKEFKVPMPSDSEMTDTVGHMSESVESDDVPLRVAKDEPKKSTDTKEKASNGYSRFIPEADPQGYFNKLNNQNQNNGFGNNQQEAFCGNNQSGFLNNQNNGFGNQGNGFQNQSGFQNNQSFGNNQRFGNNQVEFSRFNSNNSFC